MSQTLKPLTAKVAQQLARQITAGLAASYAGCHARDAARAADRTMARTHIESYIERMVYAEHALKTLIGAIAGREAELDLGEIFGHDNERPRADRYTHGHCLRSTAEVTCQAAPTRAASTPAAQVPA